MKKKITKGSHWLPRTYLKHFLLDEKLFMYKKGKSFFKEDLKPEERIVEILGEAGLNNIAKENNFYRIEAKNVDPNFIESLFGEIVENDLDKIIQAVREKNIGDRLDEELKRKLCLFMATMRVRTPQFKWETEEAGEQFLKMVIRSQMERGFGQTEKEQLKKDYKREVDKTIPDEKLNKEIEQARERISKGDFGNIRIKFPNNLFLKAALTNIEPFAVIMSNMKMNILRAKEGRYFITSDNPVVHFVPEDKVNFYNPVKSLVSPFTEVFFPITKDCAIHLCRRSDMKEMVMPADREVIEAFKEVIAHDSKDFIFSPIKMGFLNQFVEKYIPYPLKLTFS